MRESEFSTVICEPRATVMFCGLAALLAIVMVLVVTGGELDGAVVLELAPPQAIAIPHASAAPPAHILSCRIPMPPMSLDRPGRAM